MASDDVTERVVYSITEFALHVKQRLNCCIHSNSLRRAVAVMRRIKCPIKSTLRHVANRDIRRYRLLENETTVDQKILFTACQDCDI